MTFAAISVVVVCFSILILSCAALNLEGTKCGQSRCDVNEYCSPYDTQCRPCSHVCDATTHNHQPDDCVKYCQEYLHDQRYVLRTDIIQYEDLRGEIQRLRTLLLVTFTLTCLAIIAILYLLAKTFIRWKNVRSMLRNIFRKSWVKKATNNNKVQDDVEAGVTKQNGLKLTMPTISATVASASGASNPNNSTNNNDSNGNSDSNGTPNTTSTPLSRRHPSEDTTLDYAYDNPAMTPSPEAAQLRTKRESSF